MTDSDAAEPESEPNLPPQVDAAVAPMPCPNCGRQACPSRPPRHDMTPRGGPCKGGTDIRAQIDLPDWHNQDVKIYFVDACGTCNGVRNTRRTHVDATGDVHFSTPPCACMEEYISCEGHTVSVSAELLSNRLHCVQHGDSEWDPNLIALPYFKYCGRTPAWLRDELYSSPMPF